MFKHRPTLVTRVRHYRAHAPDLSHTGYSARWFWPKISYRATEPRQPTHSRPLSTASGSNPGLELPPLRSLQNHPINKAAVFFAGDDLPEQVSEPEQTRRANLGQTTDRLRALVPLLLQKSLPKEMLLHDILLRICPSHFDLINAFLPNIKGHVLYYATCKAAQIFFTSFVLNPLTKLHIQLMRVSRSAGHDDGTTKIYMRWLTCTEGCLHLLGSHEQSENEPDSFATAKAKLGVHSWALVDPGRVLPDQGHSWTVSNSIADLGKGLVGLTKDEPKLERIVSGIFIFDLDEENTHVTVHTVEDMNITERRDELSISNKLRVC